jgi:hypothetical protein
MGGGNGQKAKMAREKNMEKQKAAKGIPLFLPLSLFLSLYSWVSFFLKKKKKLKIFPLLF